LESISLAAAIQEGKNRGAWTITRRRQQQQHDDDNSTFSLSLSRSLARAFLAIKLRGNFSLLVVVVVVERAMLSSRFLMTLHFSSFAPLLLPHVREMNCMEIKCCGKSSMINGI
jgi:hypothetical protein